MPGRGRAGGQAHLGGLRARGGHQGDRAQEPTCGHRTGIGAAFPTECRGRVRKKGPGLCRGCCKSLSGAEARHSPPGNPPIPSPRQQCSPSSSSHALLEPSPAPGALLEPAQGRGCFPPPPASQILTQVPAALPAWLPVAAGITSPPCRCRGAGARCAAAAATASSPASGHG